MASREYIERLQLVIYQLHGCDSKHVQTVPVREVFRGQVAWQGEVEVFDITGHPKAKRCYARTHLDGPKDERTRFVTVLEIPPVKSPQTAVQVAIASDGVNHRGIDNRRE